MNTPELNKLITKLLDKTLRKHLTCEFTKHRFTQYTRLRLKDDQINHPVVKKALDLKLVKHLTYDGTDSIRVTTDQRINHIVDVKSLHAAKILETISNDFYAEVAEWCGDLSGRVNHNIANYLDISMDSWMACRGRMNPYVSEESGGVLNDTTQIRVESLEHEEQPMKLNFRETNRIKSLFRQALVEGLSTQVGSNLVCVALYLTQEQFGHPIVRAAIRRMLVHTGDDCIFLDEKISGLLNSNYRPQTPETLWWISNRLHSLVASEFTGSPNLTIANYLGIGLMEWLACKKRPEAVGDAAEIRVESLEHEEQPMELTPEGTQCLTDLLQQALHRSLSVPKGSSIQCYTQHLTQEQFKHPIVRAAIRHLLVYERDDCIFLSEATSYPLAHNHSTEATEILWEVSDNLYSLVAREFQSGPDLIIACYLKVGLMEWLACKKRPEAVGDARPLESPGMLTGYEGVDIRDLLDRSYKSSGFPAKTAPDDQVLYDPTNHVESASQETPNPDESSNEGPEPNNEQPDIDSHDPLTEPLPHWASSRSTELQLGSQLCTKDGRRCGNAVVAAVWINTRGEKVYDVVTDAGNVINCLSTEVEELFHSSTYVMKADNVSEIVKRVTDHRWL